MNILLVYPPQGDPTQPYLSLPALTAFLKACGYDKVRQRDLNIEAFDLFTDKSHLEGVVARLSNTAKEELDADKRIAISRALALAPSVLGRITWAKNAVRSHESFFDYPTYVRACNILFRALEIASAEYYPAIFSMHRFTTGYSTQQVEELFKATDDENVNPFIRFFSSSFIPTLAENEPDVLGISVTYDAQFIPALTLARLVKQVAPNVRIVIGGGYISNMHDLIAKERRLFSYVDAFVVHEGESAFKELLQFYEGRANKCNEMSNIIRYDRKEDRIIRGPNRKIEDVNELPPADFHDLSLDKYFSPEFVPLLDIERGCYWGRCSFCSYGVGIGPCSDYRPRKAETVVDIIKTYVELYGVKRIVFSTDAAAPAHLERIARAIEETGLSVSWHCTSRVEKSFTPELLKTLRKGGLRHLIFGVESGNQRVLDDMQKGVSIETLKTVFSDLRICNITHKSMFIVGFPGETRDEACDTLDFILDNRDIFTYVSLEPFALIDGSIAHSDPSRFGISKILHSENQGLEFAYQYETSRGMDRENIMEMYNYMWPLLQPAFGCRPYPFVESGASVHTLLYSDRYGWDKPGVSSHLNERFRDMPLEKLMKVRPCLTNDTVLTKFSLNALDYNVEGVTPLPGISIDDESRWAFYNDRDDRLFLVGSGLHKILLKMDGALSVSEIVEAFPPAMKSSTCSLFRYLLYNGTIAENQKEQTLFPESPLQSLAEA